MHEFGFLEITILFFDENKKVDFDMQVQKDWKRPLHKCAEIKWSSSMELEKSAFKEQRGEERETDLLLYTLFLCTMP